MHSSVANLSHAIAVGKLFHIPLKLPEHTVGALTPVAFYTAMSVLFAYVFLDVDDCKSFQLKQGALQSSSAIGKIVQGIVWLVQHDNLEKLRDWVGKKIGVADDDPVPDYGTKLIQRMSAGGKSVEEVAWSIVPTIAAAVGTQAQGVSQVVDLLLSDEYKHHWPEIRQLAMSKDPADFQKLEKYALECLRLATPAFGLLRNVEPATVDITDGSNTVKLKKGDQIFTNFVKCGLDPDVFPEPRKIKLDRDPANYIHHGWGSHACIGRGIVTTALATQLKCLARLKNLRRAPGGQGEMKYKVVNGAFKVYMKSDWSDYWPFPTSKLAAWPRTPTPSKMGTDANTIRAAMKVMFDEIEEW